MTDEVKQVIVIRKDLKMRRGKECAQAAHAGMIFLLNAVTGKTGLTRTELQWINGPITKICLTVNSEEELLDIHNKAIAAGLKSHIITDKGLTEFAGVPTKTCLAIGPDFCSRIDPITKDLSLY